MKVFSRYLIGLFSIFLLGGCIGENYDYSPPSVTLSHSEIELAEANIN